MQWSIVFIVRLSLCGTTQALDARKLNIKVEILQNLIRIISIRSIANFQRLISSDLVA